MRQQLWKQSGLGEMGNTGQQARCGDPYKLSLPSSLGNLQTFLGWPRHVSTCASLLWDASAGGQETRHLSQLVCDKTSSPRPSLSGSQFFYCKGMTDIHMLPYSSQAPLELRLHM